MVVSTFLFRLAVFAVLSSAFLSDAQASDPIVLGASVPMGPSDDGTSRRVLAGTPRHTSKPSTRAAEREGATATVLIVDRSRKDSFEAMLGSLSRGRFQTLILDIGRESMEITAAGSISFVREFQADAAQFGDASAVTYAGLEAYINARVVGEALRRSARAEPAPATSSNAQCARAMG